MFEERGLGIGDGSLRLGGRRSILSETADRQGRQEHRQDENAAVELPQDGGAARLPNRPK